MLYQIAFGPAQKLYQIVVVNPDPEIRGGTSVSKKDFIQPLGPQFGLKLIREAGGAGGLPLDPPLDTASVHI